MSYTDSNHTEDYLLVSNGVDDFRMFICGKQGSDIENDNQEKAKGRPSYRQSAEVCDKKKDSTSMCSSTRAIPLNKQGLEPMLKGKDSTYTAASQRIYAKELWYVQGFIEGDGSLSCYLESSKWVRAELSIGLQNADDKLVYMIRSLLGYGTVTKVKYSKTNPLRIKAEANGGEAPISARYNLRSKEIIEKDIIR